MTLPADIARCPGIEDFHAGDPCNDCLRRTIPPANVNQEWMDVPGSFVFTCPFYIPPEQPKNGN